MDVESIGSLRMAVLINMSFNMGINVLDKFGKMWKALAEGDYLTASNEMLDSRWAKQVKGRAKRLSQLMAASKD